MQTAEQLTRPSCPAVDAILGQKFPVLHDGFIRVVDYMGDDTAIVQAARVSYGIGTKTVSDDRGLIRFMMRHGHTSPFEQCKLKLHVRVPMDVWRQWIRHRTASVNEYSTRYSEAIDSQHEVESDEWRLQSSTNRQGSGETLGDWETIACFRDNPFPFPLPRPQGTPGEYLATRQNELYKHVRDVYDELHRTFGIAREQARAVLPLSTYTEAYWTIDLHNLLHFLSKRMAPDAQKEIRDYADAIAGIVKQWVPHAWEAFEDYRLNAMTFSAQEVNVLRAILEAGPPVNVVSANVSKRELGELRAKLQQLGVHINDVEQVKT